MLNNIVLILEFRNAKLIRMHKDTKDRTSVFGEKSVNRKEIGYSNFEEPITKYQISNLLHVLVGERPVNTQRFSVYDKQEWLMSLAEDSLIKYFNPKVRTNKTDSLSYVKEVTTTNKSPWDSYQNTESNWEMVRNYCESSFEEILVEFSKVFPRPLETKFSSITEEIRSSYDKTDRYNCIFDKISSIKGLTGLVNYLKTDRSKKELLCKKANSLRRGSALTISRGIDKAEYYSGEIIVFINDEILNLIKNNYKGTSTILDGGVVTIKSIEKDIDKEYLYGFIKVSDISLKKVIKNEI